MAKISTFIISGVIASSIPSHSLVVLGNIEPTKVLRVGQSIDDLEVFGVNRKWVDFKRKGELVRIMVGDGLPELKPEIESHTTENGRLTLMTEQFRDYQLSTVQLAQTLMSAGMIPIINEDGSTYYQIVKITPGSIFDIVGLQNDDLITKVNGYPLGDAANAIKTIIALKWADTWVLEVLRQETPLTLTIQLGQ